MAMAKIVGVTDVPELNGAGVLEFNDGRKGILVGPKIANEERARLEKGAGVFAAPKPETPADFRAQLAKASEQPASHEAPAPSTLPPHMQTQPSAVRVASPEEWAATHPPAAAPAPAPAAPAPATGAPAAAPAPAAPVDPLAAAQQVVQGRLIDEAVNGRIVPGTAGRKAGYTPSAQSTTTERGPEYNEADAAKRQGLAAATLDAQQSKATADAERASAEAKMFALANLKSQQEEARLKADMLEREQQHKRRDAAMQKDLADYSESAKPDPRKYWTTPGGAVSGLISSIAQGLGAFAAIRSGTENFAFKSAQARIQREMAAQEKAYDNGRGDRKSAYARMVQQYEGDQDMARLALQQALNKTGETETNRFAAQSRSEAITNNAKILAAQFAQDADKAEQARKDLAAGKTTQTEQQRYQTAIAASGPHRVMDTPQTAAKNLETAEKLGNGNDDPTFQANRLKYGEKKEAEAPARDLVAKLAGRIGATRDPETGKWTMPKGKDVSVRGHGVGGILPNALVGQAGRDFRNDMADLNLQVGKMVSGADVPEGTMDQIRNLSGAGGADSDILPGLNRMQDKIDSAALERDSTYGVKVREAHEAEKNRVVALNKKNPLNVKQTKFE